MRYIYLLLFISIAIQSTAQVELSTQLYGSGGANYAENDLHLSSAMGEVFVNTVILPDEQAYTQGLLQPGGQLINDGKLKIYNAFSPNGDEENDSWIIDNLDEFEQNGVVKADVYIFNRYGVRVWIGKNYDNDKVVWKGTTNKGEELADGTYFYVIEINNTNTYKGWVEITR